METLKDFLKNWENTLTGASWLEDEKGNITNLTWEWDNILYSITSPHKGNDFTYMLRVNPKVTFDKWGNADIEEFFDDIDELNYYLEHRDWIKNALLDIYINRYLENYND